MNVSNHTRQPAMTAASFTTEQPPRTSPPPIPVSPTLTPDTSNGWMLALAALALLFLCAAGGLGIWYFFLR